MLDNKSVSLWIDTIWQKAREAVIKAARNPDAAFAGKLGEVLKSMGTTLESDPANPRRDQPIRSGAQSSGMSASYGSSMVQAGLETVRGWDARTVTARLEAAVGRDLQYIRINGTWLAASSASPSTSWTRCDHPHS